MPAQSFKVGEAPWERSVAPKSFTVGQAPWETSGEFQGTGKPNAPEEPGLSGGTFNPMSSIDLLGGSSKAFGANAANKLTMENIPSLRKAADREAMYSPVSAAAGKVAGLAGNIGATGAVGGAIMEPAQGIKGIAQAVGTGAATGAAQYPGENGSRLDNAAIGAGVGLGTAALSEGIGAIGRGAETLAEKGAARAIGGQKSQFKKLAARSPDRPAEVGRFAIDEGILSKTNDADEILSKAGSVAKSAGEKIGSIFDKVEAGGGHFDRKEIGARLRDSLLKNEDIIDSLDADVIVPKLEKYINSFESKSGTASAKELLKLKGMLDGRINYSKKAVDLPELQQGYKELRNTLANAIEEKASALADQNSGNLGASLREANKRYGLAMDAKKLAENKVAQQGNNFFSLTDKIGAGIGGGLGFASGGLSAIPGMMAGATASKGVRTFGPYAGVKIADAASGLSRVPGNQYLTSASINALIRQAMESK